MPARFLINDRGALGCVHELYKYLIHLYIPLKASTHPSIHPVCRLELTVLNTRGMNFHWFFQLLVDRLGYINATGSLHYTIVIFWSLAILTPTLKWDLTDHSAGVAIVYERCDKLSRWHTHTAKQISLGQKNRAVVAAAAAWVYVFVSGGEEKKKRMQSALAVGWHKD